MPDRHACLALPRWLAGGAGCWQWWDGAWGAERNDDGAIPAWVPHDGHRAGKNLAQQRLCQRLPRGAGRNQASIAQDGNAIGKTGCEIQVMQHDQHRAPGSSKLPRNAHHELLMAQVERGGRLVEQEDGCFLRQHAGEGDARLLATGE
ncbi:MAG: hypothetical protein KatS3mg059_0064 [Thermomicrobiales bacterium]|nr:MAG: hypothetical protein KatS3mg059_0064 [Thermomicrobiales bacterium]